MKQYVIMISPEHLLPKVVSTNSHEYPELKQIGYEVIFNGNKSACEQQAEEMLSEMYVFN